MRPRPGTIMDRSPRTRRHDEVLPLPPTGVPSRPGVLLALLAMGLIAPYGARGPVARTSSRPAPIGTLPPLSRRIP